MERYVASSAPGHQTSSQRMSEPKIVRPRVDGRPYSTNICRAVDGDCRSPFVRAGATALRARAAAAKHDDGGEDKERCGFTRSWSAPS